MLFLPESPSPTELAKAAFVQLQTLVANKRPNKKGRRRKKKAHLTFSPSFIKTVGDGKKFSGPRRHRVSMHVKILFQTDF